MSELEPNTTPQAELQQLTFQPTPREFSADDVVNVQNYMQRLHGGSIAEGADYIPSPTGLYDALTETHDSNAEQEPSADEHSFDKTISTLLGIWGKRTNMPGSAPQTLSETIDVFTKNPKLNKTSTIHFQGSAEYVTGRFIHVATGRAIGKHREPATCRYYLNPRADKMGEVVEELTGAALQAEIPLYFKFVNVATGKPNARTFARNDRVVIYASKSQIAFVEDILGQVTTKNPEAFAGRKIAGFGEVLTDGVTRADDVTVEQNDKFKGQSEGTSFNDLRSKLVYEATLGVTRDLISFPEYATVKVAGQTIREKFAGEISKEISKRNPGTVIKEDDPMLLEAIQLGLTSEQLSADGRFSDGAVRAIQDAVSKVARDVIPRIQPDSLLQGYQYHVRQLAPKYGIDPDNLARNVPIVV